ncbi:MAG: hypothetical protein R3Y24_15885 [Eubacteriales bacterium]
MSLNATLDYAEYMGELRGELKCKQEMIKEMLKMNMSIEDIKV